MRVVILFYIHEMLILATNKHTYRIFDIKTRAIIRPVSLILPEFSATKNEKKCPNVVK